MKIVRTDAELHLPTLDDRLRAEGHDLVLLGDGVSEDVLADALRDADILMMCYTPVTRAVMDSARNLRGIVKYGVGIDAIDIPAARERGIAVVNVPEYAEQTVAEGAFLLMLALLRKLPALMAQMTSAGWTWPEPRWLGRDVSGLTVGLIGFGRIGQQMAKMAGRGFDARVIACDPHQSDAVFGAAGVERVSLEDLLQKSDVISLHTVLNEDTHQMIGRKEFAQMKSEAVLINVSRGALVDETALIEALDAHKIAAAGLDVFEAEPLSPGHPLQNRKNVILLPHLTFWTEDAMRRLEDDTYARLRELMDDRPVTIRSTDPRLKGQAGAAYPDLSSSFR